MKHTGMWAHFDHDKSPGSRGKLISILCFVISKVSKGIRMKRKWFPAALNLY
jgi:hypothetical protein